MHRRSSTKRGRRANEHNVYASESQLNHDNTEHPNDSHVYTRKEKHMGEHTHTHTKINLHETMQGHTIDAQGTQGHVKHPETKQSFDNRLFLSASP